MGAKASLLPTPVGLRVGTFERQLLYVASIRQHFPDLVGARAVRLKDNVTAIRRPAGKIIATRVVGELHPLLAGNIHQIKVVRARLSRPVLALPGEGKKLSVWRPVWRDRVTLLGDPLHVGAVGLHGIDLRQAAASAYEGDLRA